MVKRFIPVVLVIYFFSGACALIYETIWLRLFKLVFGNTTIAASVTIAIFMAGLAVGAMLIGPKADAIKNKLKVYAFLEILLTVFALCTLPILAGVDHLYTALFRMLLLSPSALLSIQIIVSSMVLFIPTCMMGMTLPLLSSWLIKRREMIGVNFGLLYGVNTAGALLGTFLAGFYLIENLGVKNSLYLTALMNVVIGLTALGMSGISEDAKTINQEKELTKDGSGEIPLGVVNAWLFMSGFVALGFEIIWIRTTIHYLKATIYSFSAILCIYLLGYFLGVLSGGRLVKKLKNHLMPSILIMQSIGLTGVLYIPVLIWFSNTIAIRYSVVTNHLLFSLDRYFNLAYCAVLFIVPSFLMGLNFPFLMHLRNRSQKEIGSSVASGYGINTLGSVIGPLAAGFCLIPLFGSQLSIEILGIIGVASALLAIPYLKKRFILPVALLALTIALTVCIPHHLYLTWLNQVEGKDAKTELVDVAEGITTTASVHHYVEQNFTVITTAGINVAGDQITLRQTQKAQGHIPVILFGNPKSVLSVGFGSGELTRLLTLHDIPSITCCELSPEMVKLSKKHFSHINLGKDLEKKVTMVYMDAKNYIHLTDKKYDIILNDAIWPGMFADNSSLYTKEYFADGKRALTDSGVYSTWLPLNLPEQSMKSIVKTFMSEFENTLLVYPHFTPSLHMLLIGQKKAHKYSYASMQAQFNKPAVMESLKMLGVRTVDDILDFVFIDATPLKIYSGGAPVNSDYFPVVEYGANLYRCGFNVYQHWENLYSMMLCACPGDFNVCAPVNLSDYVNFNAPKSDSTEKSLDKSLRADRYLIMSFMYLDPQKNMQAIQAGLAIDPLNFDLVNRKALLETNR